MKAGKVKARKMWRTDGERRGQFEVSTTKWMEFVDSPTRKMMNTPVFVLPADAASYNAIRWNVEQTYLKCADCEITDPWEIAALVLASLGITNPETKKKQ